jgi:hypothetical protein
VQRVPTRHSYVRSRVTSLVLAIASAVGLFAAPAVSEAGPITYTYVGSITSTFNQTLAPLGSPATIQLTVSDVNVWVGQTGCAPHPEGGAYAYSAVVSFLGLSVVAGGYFEVNYDFYGCVPQPGVKQVWFGSTVSGPSLAPDLPPTFPPAYSPFANCSGGGGGSRCQIDPLGTYQPDYASAAMPTFSTFGYRIAFTGDCTSGIECLPGGDVVVAGTPVPEPTTLVLLGIGLAGIVARVRASKRGGESAVPDHKLMTTIINQRVPR